MANVCYNEFLISCEDSEIINKIENKLTELFASIDIDIWYCEDGYIEGSFESRWNFPMNLFSDFFNEFKDDTIYMRCLSTEWSCNYVAMNVYTDGKWKPEQTFDF